MFLVGKSSKSNLLRRVVSASDNCRLQILCKTARVSGKAHVLCLDCKAAIHNAHRVYRLTEVALYKAERDGRYKAIERLKAKLQIRWLTYKTLRENQCSHRNEGAA